MARSETGDMLAMLHAEGWSQAALGRALGRDPRAIRDAISGAKPYDNLRTAVRALTRGDRDAAATLSTQARRRDTRGQLVPTRGVTRTGSKRAGLVGSTSTDAGLAALAAQLQGRSGSPAISVVWKRATLDGVSRQSVEVTFARGGLRMARLRALGFRGTARSLARALAKACNDGIVGRSPTGGYGTVGVDVDSAEDNVESINVFIGGD